MDGHESTADGRYGAGEGFGVIFSFCEDILYVEIGSFNDGT